MGCCRGTRHTPDWAFTILLSLLTIGAARAGDQPTLRFSVGDQRIATLDLDQLRSQLPTHDIALRDPHYQAQKDFRVFALADVLDLGFGERWRGDDYPEVVFIASDGYQGLGSINKLGAPGGYVAFADLDLDAGWEPMGKVQINPGPFYIVWSGAEQRAAKAYPRPWQLAEIAILRLQDQYPAVYPLLAGLNKRQIDALERAFCEEAKEDAEDSGPAYIAKRERKRAKRYEKNMRW